MGGEGLKEPFLNNFENWGEIFDTFIQPKFKIEKVIFDDGMGNLYSHPKEGSIKKGDYYIIVNNLKNGKNLAYKFKEPTEEEIRDHKHTIVFTESFAWRRKSFINNPPSVTELFGWRVDNENPTYGQWQKGLELCSTGNDRYWSKDAEFYIIDLNLISNNFLNWDSFEPWNVK